MPIEQLLPQINDLATAQLIVEESPDQFAFRHALVREAVYSGLLLRERKRYHRLIGETMERLAADAVESDIGDLAYHFYQAEVWERALVYSKRAGEKAQMLYAPREAIEHFSRALDAAQHLDGKPPADLNHARGQVLELVGDFEGARADYEHALEQARDMRDARAEWQALIALGFLWASRDYDQTGRYFQQALQVARSIGDPSLVARSLNRVGNWSVNIDRPGEGLNHHREALETLERLGDRGGIAETLDLLGMASFLSGDMVQGVAYYNQAVELFEELDYRQGLASSLAMLSQRAGALNFFTAIAPGKSLREAALEGFKSLKVARAIGHRAGEAFACITLAGCFGIEGEYGRALEYGQKAMEIAQEINHRQWQCAASTIVGIIELDLFAYDDAQQHLDRGLDLARQTRTRRWIATASHAVARYRVERGDPDSAASVIAAAFEPQELPESDAQRMLWVAMVQVALARHDEGWALDMVDKLISSLPGLTDQSVVPSIWKLWGEALLALGRTREAASVLAQARDTAARLGARPMLWRIQVLLAKAEMKENPEVARPAIAEASRLVDELAATIPGRALREQFVRAAGEWIAAAMPVG